MDVAVGSRVEVRGNKGTVRYIGATEFAEGKWIGIEYDEPVGKNDGSVQGKQYFSCKANHGSFVRPNQVQPIVGESDASASASPALDSAIPLNSSSSSNIATAEPGSSAPSSTATPSSTSSVSSSAPASSVATPVAVGTDREVFQLRDKVANLEAKRAEDRQQIKELEKFRIQYEQMVEYKTKWASAQHELQLQLKEVRREAKEASEARDKMALELDELRDTAEMATLDKEAAEEKMDTLQSEVDMLKEKVEELTLDLEIARGEKEEGSAEVASSSAPGAAAASMSVEYKQMEAQNERLKEALVKLRDLASNEKQELTAKVASLEKDASQARELLEKNGKLRQEIAALEETVTELKQSVDDAMGAAEMVEKLTNTNLDLEERVHSLMEQVDDLEALKDVSEELEEGHIEAERQMQIELDNMEATIRQLHHSQNVAQETMADYESSLSKYRELVRNLQAEIDELRRQQAAQQGETKEMANQSQSLLSLNMQLQSTALKAQAKAIDLELRRLDAFQANDQFDIFKEFMPDSFFHSEFDAIKTVLLFRRLAFKAHLLHSQTRQLFGLDRDPALLLFQLLAESPSTPEEDRIRKDDRLKGAQDLALDFLSRREALLYGLRLVVRLTDLIRIFARFNNVLQICEVELYLKLGFMYSELATHEKRLDAFIELIRSEKLSQTVSLDVLDKSIASLSHVASTYLAPAITSSSTLSLHTIAVPTAILVATASAAASSAAPSLPQLSTTNSVSGTTDPELLEWDSQCIEANSLRAMTALLSIWAALFVCPKISATKSGGDKESCSVSSDDALKSILLFLVNQMKQIREYSRRIIRRLPSLQQQQGAIGSVDSNPLKAIHLRIDEQDVQALQHLNFHCSRLAAQFEALSETLLSGMDDASNNLSEMAPVDTENWLEAVEQWSASVGVNSEEALAKLAVGSGNASTLSFPEQIAPVGKFIVNMVEVAEYFSNSLQKGSFDHDSGAASPSPSSNSSLVAKIGSNDSGAPWSYRAAIMKEELSEATTLREALDQRTSELANLSAQLKLKERELADAGFRSDTLEKKFTSLKLENERLEEIKTQHTLAQTQIKQLEETVDALHLDIDVYEKEVSDLQKQLKVLRKTGGGGNAGVVTHAPPTSSWSGASTPAQQAQQSLSQSLQQQVSESLPSVGPSPMISPHNRSLVNIDTLLSTSNSMTSSDTVTLQPIAAASVVARYEARLEALEFALRHVRLENASLRGLSAQSQMQALPNLNVPKAFISNSVPSIKEEMLKVSTTLKDATLLAKSIQNKAVTTKVIRLSSPRSRGLPNETLFASLQLKHAVEDLQALTGSALTELAKSGISSSFQSQFAKFSDSRLFVEPLKIAKISIPLASQEITAQKPVIVNYDDLQKIHAVFVK